MEQGRAIAADGEARSWSEGGHSFKLQYHLTPDSLGRGWLPLPLETGKWSEVGMT